LPARLSPSGEWLHGLQAALRPVKTKAVGKTESSRPPSLKADASFCMARPRRSSEREIDGRGAEPAFLIFAKKSTLEFTATGI
jgi:hypothetical protein